MIAHTPAALLAQLAERDWPRTLSVAHRARLCIRALLAGHSSAREKQLQEGTSLIFQDQGRKQTAGEVSSGGQTAALASWRVKPRG